MSMNSFEADALIRSELTSIYTFLRQYSRELIVVTFAMLFLTLAEHHSIGSRWADSLLFYAALPLLTILIILRKNPLDFGLRIGNPGVWGLHVLAVCVISLPILYVFSKAGSFEDYYTISDFTLPVYFLEMIGYQAGWEFIFRGFLLFGLKERFKEGAILIQMIPFLMLHLGKPEVEVISTIPMGIYFGYIAYRGNSFWPAFMIHLYINVLFRVFVNWF